MVAILVEGGYVVPVGVGCVDLGVTDLGVTDLRVTDTVGHLAIEVLDVAQDLDAGITIARCVGTDGVAQGPLGALPAFAPLTAVTPAPAPTRAEYRAALERLSERRSILPGPPISSVELLNEIYDDPES